MSCPAASFIISTAGVSVVVTGKLMSSGYFSFKIPNACGVMMGFLKKLHAVPTCAGSGSFACL